jgi:HEAT repeat protein
MKSPIQAALAKLKSARSIDEGDDISDQLAKAARKNPQEIIDLYYTSAENTITFDWCLKGVTDDSVIEWFKDVLKHKDHWVRWAAIEGLKHSRRRSLIPDFIAALNDRSHMVKAVAVEWLKSHGDARAIAPLERLIKQPSMIKTSPGIIKDAQAAIERLSVKAASSPK